ncbi:hypothetical protein ABEB36_015568 [Hypothenemus hampei]|uniref:Uncharacterized protein n=1 Tax=Hypothenemus hampei TaxID=57062 RepID=A0ABD1DZA7_HYPHA
MKSKEDTALKKFFDSMCGQTSTLPNNLQIRVHRQIFNIVMEARETNIEKEHKTPDPVFPTHTQYKHFHQILVLQVLPVIQFVLRLLSTHQHKKINTPHLT